MREALGDWELSPIAAWQSGAPFSIGGGSSQSAYGESGYGGGCLQFCAGDRADRVPGVPLKVRQGGRGQWEKQYFNPNAFVARHAERALSANSGRDLIYGPPEFQHGRSADEEFPLFLRGTHFSSASSFSPLSTTWGWVLRIPRRPIQPLDKSTAAPVRMRLRHRADPGAR